IRSATSYAGAAYTSAADYVAPMYSTASSMYVSKRAEAIASRDASRAASRSSVSARASVRASSRSSKSESKSTKRAGDGFRITKPPSSSSSISISPSLSTPPIITKIRRNVVTKIHWTPTATNILTTVSRGEAWYSGYGIRTTPSVPISTAPEAGKVGGLNPLAATAGWAAAMVLLGKLAKRRLRGVGRTRAVASSSAAASVPSVAPLPATESQVQKQGPLAPPALPRPDKLAVSARSVGQWRTM
ncbi:hypothetical protein LTS18_009747, partial [Coniosporium uncinatum]